MQNRQCSRVFARLFNVFLGSSVFMLATLANAGPAEPPLNLLFAPESRLITAELIEINPTGRLVFRREKVFGTADDVPQLVDVSVTTQALKNARIGERYIVGYTTSTYDKQYPAGVAPSRKNSRVISSSGLDPALFLDSPELRRILKLAASERGRESAKLRDLLLNTFAEDKPLFQRLAAAQFALDTEMSSKLSRKDKMILREAAFNEKINPTTRSILLTGASDRPDHFGDWAGDAIKMVLEITPVDGYPRGPEDHTGLVLLSFDEASELGIEIPFESLTRWLYSHQQLYVERATTLLESLYPERRKSAFELALRETDRDSDSATHQFLNRKLRELDQQQVDVDAQRH